MKSPVSAHPCSLVPRCLALCLAAVLAPLHALGQWSGVAGINNSVVVDTSINPQGVVMVADGAGGAAFLWRDGRVSNSDTNLYAQRLNAEGARMWGDNGTPICALPGNIDEHAMVADGQGGFFLAWVDQRTINGAPTRHVWVQRLNAQGEAQWGTDGRLLREFGTLLFADLGRVVLPDGAGGVYVMTQAQQMGTSDFARRVYRLTGDGLPAAGWTAAGLDVTAGSVNYTGAIFSDQPSGQAGAHGVLLIFVTQGGGIVGRRVLADGSLGFLTPVYTFFGTYTFKGACSDGAGGAFIVTGINADLFYFHLLADGTFAWPENDRRVALPGGTVNSEINVESDGAGGAIVTWLGSAPGSTELRMTAQRIAANGTRMWGDLGVEVHAPGGVYGGRSVADGSGGVIVSWGVANPSEVRAQRLDGSGAKLWPAQGVLVSQPWGPTQLVSDQASGAIYTVVSALGGGGYAFGAKRTTLTGTLGSNSPTARLANISARAVVGAGANVLIPGFVVSEGPMQLLIRGVGPGLLPYGVSGVVADPRLTLVSQGGTVLSTNDDWSLAANAAEVASASTQVNAFALAGGSKDAALLVTLQPGIYTAIMSSAVEGASGVGLVELYEVPGALTTGRLANMSVRAPVGTGDTILIPGIVIGGTGARTLLIRAVGPTLAGFGVSGVLANPTMTLYSGSTAIGANDSWGTNGTQVSTIGTQVGAFGLPAGSADAALLVTLAPGLYTAHVSGVSSGTGVCLVEVYEVP